MVSKSRNWIDFTFCSQLRIEHLMSAFTIGEMKRIIKNPVYADACRT